MRKLSSFLSRTNRKLIIPSDVVTVGPSNCDYISLSEATLNSPDGSKFIVYAGIYDGLIYLKKNCDFTFLGRSVLKQSEDQYLFKFVEPSDWDGFEMVNILYYFSGTSPYFDPFDHNKWFMPPGDYSIMTGFFSLIGLYLERHMRIECTVNDPVVYDNDIMRPEFKYYCNFNLDKLNVNPIYIRDFDWVEIQLVPAGIPTPQTFYNVNIMPDSVGDRHFSWTQQSYPYVLDLEIRDGMGAYKDDFKAQVYVKCPLFIEF